MMRLTSVTCGSVSLSVSPGGSSRTCWGRVCFGGFIRSFPKHLGHRGKSISVGKVPFACWTEQGSVGLASCSQTPVIWGYNWSWGERGSWGRCLLEDPAAAALSKASAMGLNSHSRISPKG